MNQNIEKLLNIASGEIGYLEKASNRYLDDKTKNAGSANYTKYGRDLVKWLGEETGDTYGISYQWCDEFCDWCFVTAFGIKAARALLLGWSAYTPTSSQYFKNKGQWHTGADCQPGDQIFFRNSTRICHTGIVEKVENGVITTIEGNTSSVSGVVSNGGCVRRKQYKIGDSYIAGYGRPNWSILDAPIDTSKPGWYQDDIGKWYRHTKGSGPDTYYHNVVKEIDGKCYAFNENGYLIKKTISRIGFGSGGELIVR